MTVEAGAGANPKFGSGAPSSTPLITSMTWKSSFQFYFIPYLTYLTIIWPISRYYKPDLKLSAGPFRAILTTIYVLSYSKLDYISAALYPEAW